MIYCIYYNNYNSLICYLAFKITVKMFFSAVVRMLSFLSVFSATSDLRYCQLTNI